MAATMQTYLYINLIKNHNTLANFMMKMLTQNFINLVVSRFLTFVFLSILEQQQFYETNFHCFQFQDVLTQIFGKISYSF